MQYTIKIYLLKFYKETEETFRLLLICIRI